MALLKISQLKKLGFTITQKGIVKKDGEPILVNNWHDGGIKTKEPINIFNDYRTKIIYVNNQLVFYKNFVFLFQIICLKKEKMLLKFMI
jgi:hypothetical protein